MAEVQLEDVSRRLRDTFDKGFSAFERSNLDYAISMFEAVVEQEPRLLKARKYLRAAEVRKFLDAGSGKSKHMTALLANLPGLIKAVGRNARRGFPDCALFEIGPVFSGDQPGDQRTAITAVLAPHGPRRWDGAAGEDLFTLKADLIALLEELGAPYRVVPVNIGRGDQFSPEFLALNPNCQC